MIFPAFQNLSSSVKLNADIFKYVFGSKLIREV